MKKVSILFLVILLNSCAVTSYYQVYKSIPESGAIINDKIIFEDKNCSVTYDLFTEGGNFGFSIFNKSEGDLTVDLTKTFFVINSVSYEYFQNRTFTNSVGSGTTVTTNNFAYYNYWNSNSTKVSGTSSSNTSTSFEEKSELTIPALTIGNVSEYRVTNSRYSNCDLPKYPSNDKVKTMTFEKSNSPFVFYNLITYKVLGDSMRMENKFFVSEITNLPESEMLTTVETSVCGKKLDFPVKVLKKLGPDKFYVHYTKD